MRRPVATFGGDHRRRSQAVCTSIRSGGPTPSVSTVSRSRPPRAPSSESRLPPPSIRCFRRRRFRWRPARLFRVLVRSLRPARRRRLHRSAGELEVHRDHLRAGLAQVIDHFGVVGAREGKLRVQSGGRASSCSVAGRSPPARCPEGAPAGRGSRSARRSSAVRCAAADGSRRRARRGRRPARQRTSSAVFRRRHPALPIRVSPCDRCPAGQRVMLAGRSRRGAVR